MAVKGNSGGPGRSGNKSDRGGNGTLGAGSDFNVQGPAEGFRDGGRDDMGNKVGAVEQGGGLLGGFFNPGRMAGAGIGTLIGGPIGGLLGGLIGSGMGRGGQRGSWGYTDAQGNRVSAARDMIDGGGRGRFGDRFEGGLLSGIGNSLGIRPAGYRARQAQGGAQMTPDQIRAEMAGQAPRSFAPQPAEPASPSMTPASPAPMTPANIPMSAQPGMMSPPPGQTMPRALTAEDLARLSQVGMGMGAGVGSPATPEEMAFLVRGPDMMPPQQQRPMEPANPALLSRQQPSLADLQNFLAGNAMTSVQAPSPGAQNFNAGVNVGRSDLGTIRPHVSRAQTLPMQGFAPVMDILPSSPPPNAGLLSNPSLLPSRYGGQSFDVNAVRAATAAERARMAAERANRGNTIRREYFTPLQ